MITGKSRGMWQLASQQGHKNRVQPHDRKLDDRQPRYINRKVVKTQLASTRQTFKVSNMPKLSLATCCKVLQEIASIRKYKTMSPLS